MKRHSAYEELIAESRRITDHAAVVAEHLRQWVLRAEKEIPKKEPPPPERWLWKS